MLWDLIGALKRLSVPSTKWIQIIMTRSTLGNFINGENRIFVLDLYMSTISYLIRLMHERVMICLQVCE